MKKIFLIVLGVYLTACSIDPLDFYNPINQGENLKNGLGRVVQDCTGTGRYIREGEVAERFWKENKLPKGTTEFVCVDGKAYLPGKEPKK